MDYFENDTASAAAGEFHLASQKRPTRRVGPEVRAKVRQQCRDYGVQPPDTVQFSA
jgi:hypothetical protein